MLNVVTTVDREGEIILVFRETIGKCHLRGISLLDVNVISDFTQSDR